MPDWFSNGEAVENVSISDRGFQYGDGLFETVAIRKGQPRLWSYHVDRLTRGCKLLGIKMPSENELSGGLEHALHNSKVLSAYAVAKIVISAGVGLRGYGRTFADSPAVFYRAFPAAPLALESYSGGIDTVICRTRLASGSATAGLKTLNRMEQVLARSEFIETDVFEGLTMDAEDNIICGTMSNVFFINDKSISTPPLNRCGVEGVMRRHVIETLRQQGTDIEIRPCALSDIEAVDEVFLSNSQFGILPVKSCMQMQWGVGEVTQDVMSLLANNAVPECRL
jgi:4-amino-4-deoxychorismate lyase